MYVSGRKTTVRTAESIQTSFPLLLHDLSTLHNTDFLSSKK